MIQLTEEQKKQIKDAIYSYYYDERGEEIGIIHQEGLFDLFMEELAPIIYNRAIDDAKKWFSNRIADIETDFYELYNDI